jgi:hypothetical protein
MEKLPAAAGPEVAGGLTTLAAAMTGMVVDRAECSDDVRFLAGLDAVPVVSGATPLHERKKWYAHTHTHTRALPRTHVISSVAHSLSRRPDLKGLSEEPWRDARKPVIIRDLASSDDEKRSKAQVTCSRLCHVRHDRMDFALMIKWISYLLEHGGVPDKAYLLHVRTYVADPQRLV